jgi:peptidyl-prolyl cis-trans isomerase D
MAVLSKIRQRSLLLILIIGFCLLAFILVDIIKSGGFGVTRNIGSVNGKDIPVQEFLQKVNDVQARQQGISSTQAANSVWGQEVEGILFEERYEKAGLRVGRDHVFNVYAQDPSVAQNPQFLNALGKFDKAKFNEFLVNMKTTNPAQWQMIEKNKGQVEDAAKKQLYITMLKSGFFATDIDGQAKYKLESEKATFDYVFVPYSTINDDQVKVSDAEITEYMKKNEKKYKSEASRDLEFVLIENKPSAEDEAEIKKNITSLLSPKVEYNEVTKTNDTIGGFRTVTNVEEFVNKNSDIKYDSTYVTKKELPLDHAEQIYNLGNGEVFGPYIDNGYYKLTKMINKKGNASVKASHILIAFAGSKSPDPSIKRTKEEAKAKADDLLKQVNANPAGFAALAMANTDDPGSKQNGGEYDNIAPGKMVKPFNDFIFNNPVGTTGVIETDFGYHVMKVTAKYEAVQLATIAQKIEPSEATTDAVFTKASKMEMEAGDKDFTALAKELNLTVVPATKVMANDENVQGIGSQRAIVKWAFGKDTEVGNVKKFDIPQGHVIVKLKNINEKGLLPMEEAKLSVLPILRNEKKAVLVRKKMEGTTLEAVAQKTGSSVAIATDVTMANPLVPGVGAEPKVIGKAFGIGAGKTSGLIDGQLGVFMIRTKSIAKAAALPNYSAYTTRLKGESRAGVQSRISMALRDNADIEDNRSEFN